MNDPIDDKVRELIEKFRIRKPPVPVERIVKKLGLSLVALPAGDEISGAIIRKGDSVVIAVNPLHHVHRRRFTIAHELGHYFLHEGLLEEHVDQNLRIAWRNADSSKAVNWLEIQANRFAAELLMPTDLLTRDLDSLRRIEKRTVALLATAYKVSPAAMKIRLTNLGITGPF
jgi:Zn-dependent peptidase ImmA (M78 family)